MRIGERTCGSSRRQRSSAAAAWRSTSSSSSRRKRPSVRSRTNRPLGSTYADPGSGGSAIPDYRQAFNACQIIPGIRAGCWARLQQVVLLAAQREHGEAVAQQVGAVRVAELHEVVLHHEAVADLPVRQAHLRSSSRIFFACT